MREFIQRQRDAREYDAFLSAKSGLPGAGLHHADEGVEAEFVRAAQSWLRGR
jgi:hypothetical protein